MRSRPFHRTPLARPTTPVGCTLTSSARVRSAVGDFWNRRWNMTVSAVLRAAVYDVIMEGELQLWNVSSLGWLLFIEVTIVV